MLFTLQRVSGRGVAVKLGQRVAPNKSIRQAKPR
jgi:hypothetical protein